MQNHAESTNAATRRTGGVTIAVVVVITGLIASILTGARAASDDPGDRMQATITYPTAPRADHRALVEWAVSRYSEAGLELPDMEVTFPTSCDGKAGRYLVGKGVLELCTPNRTLVLHEMAHAWEDVHRIDREAFMAFRGLDHWYESECESPKDSGGEQLAIIMTWGLHEVDTSARHVVDPTLPADQQPRSIPGLDDSDPDTLREAFILATGVEPLVATP